MCHMLRAFHLAWLKDEWGYLFLDGISLMVRRPSGRIALRLHTQF